MPHWAATHFTFRKTNGNRLMYFVKLDTFFFFFLGLTSCPPKSLALLIPCSLWQSSWNQRQFWSDSKFRFSYSAIPDTVFSHIWGRTKVLISHLWSEYYPISNLSIRFTSVMSVIGTGPTEALMGFLNGPQRSSGWGNPCLGTEVRPLVVSRFSALGSVTWVIPHAPTFSSISTWKE